LADWHPARQQNSERLYQGLGDKDLIVKKNTLMVLTHLILNGMIKVKGQLGEMAKCTEDEEPRVSDLAKLFFDELSKKDNSLYNNLQDIISHLSVGQHAVDEEMFEKIMKTVFGYIEKVRRGWIIRGETWPSSWRLDSPNRKSKLKALSRSYASGSDWLIQRDNGVTLHSAFLCFHSSRIDL
jgi:hypothetical protein